jgi:hypothetical protein
LYGWGLFAPYIVVSVGILTCEGVDVVCAELAFGVVCFGWFVGAGACWFE